MEPLNLPWACKVVIAFGRPWILTLAYITYSIGTFKDVIILNFIYKHFQDEMITQIKIVNLFGLDDNFFGIELGQGNDLHLDKNEELVQKKFESFYKNKIIIT